MVVGLSDFFVVVVIVVVVVVDVLLVDVVACVVEYLVVLEVLVEPEVLGFAKSLIAISEHPYVFS